MLIYQPAEDKELVHIILFNLTAKGRKAAGRYTIEIAQKAQPSVHFLEVCLSNIQERERILFFFFF